ncbi:MAG: VWA domain-containing protein [Chloroflexi bacterium]|nr:VWA domain-containing protein [Chloroflexota bacterium]
MKHFRPFLLLLLLLIPLVALHAAQTTPAPRLEITGVNASQMPTVTVTANVYDTLGQPVLGLTAADFTLTGDLVGIAQITNVENITDNNLPFAVVLAIDVSSSMSGVPFENAKQAAHAFIENIGPNDPVAILTFSSHVGVVQDYTTDKSTLSAAIDALRVGGETALYQGAYEAIQTAADSPTPRRAVILLSDGAEYGGISHVGRGDATDEAIKSGVPVYSIGVGFGFDRTYLQGISSSTNAQTYESPTSEELTQIYTDLAAKLRSQYVVTLNVPLPLDGTQYNLGLEVTTSEGTADAAAVLRAPIPVPIVRLPDLSDPLAQPTDITATILHDDPLKSVTFQVNGRPEVTASTEPYTFTVNPVDYPPGSYILTVTAVDANDDTGTGTLNFGVAALPSDISLSPELTAQTVISAAQTFTVETSGQTAATAVSVAFNNGQPTDLTAPYSFTIDPIFFTPGSYTVTVSVTNEGGVTSTRDFPFTIPTLPPQITIVGVQDGQSVSAPVKFTVQVTGQQPVAQISATAGSVTLERAADESFTLDPMMFPPGATALTITATLTNGASGTAQINFIVAPLPPQIIVHGLTAGETLTADREVTLDFVTQTPVIHVAFFVDGQDLAHQIHAPYGITLAVLDYAPGDHNLRIIADDADGQSSTLDLPFTISSAPAVTATAAALAATQSAIATATRQAVQTADASQATQSAQASATQVANASATAVAVVATNAAQATQGAQATGTQIANASETAAALMAINASATQAAQASATQINAATQTAAALIAQQATATAAVEQATQTAQVTATQQAAITATAQQLVVIATGDARSTQEQVSAQGTGTAVAQATANDLSTQTASQQQATQTSEVLIQAMLATQSVQQANATATSGALATLSGQATQNAQAIATQAAHITATQAAQATLDARATIRAQALAQAQAATRDALSTANAQARLSAQATQDTRATRNAAATVTAQANAATAALKATNEAIFATATQQIVEATQTQAAQASATAAAQQTLDALAATATQTAVEATQTQAAQATATAAAQQTLDALQATATQVVLNATATQQAQVIQSAASATAAAQQTLDALQATATQVVLNATATRHALETEAADNATATQITTNATATAAGQIAQATTSAQETLVVVATANRAAQLTVTAQQVANDATSTGVVNEIATRSAGLTATANAQGTLDTRLTAVGPTATPLDSGAQNVATPEVVPTLTEIQAQEPPASANIAPIAIVVIFIIVLILVLVLIMRGRGAPKR